MKNAACIQKLLLGKRVSIKLKNPRLFGAFFLTSAYIRTKSSKCTPSRIGVSAEERTLPHTV